MGRRRWGCRRTFAAKNFDPTFGIDLLHNTFIFFFAGFGLRLVALDAFDILDVVDVP